MGQIFEVKRSALNIILKIAKLCMGSKHEPAWDVKYGNVNYAMSSCPRWFCMVISFAVFIHEPNFKVHTWAS